MASERKGPLAGIRVLELPNIGPLQHTGMILADLGAEVLRLERKAHVDVGTGLQGSCTPFSLLDRGRRSGGADFVFECIGLVPTVEQAVAMTGRGGTTVLVGVVPLGKMASFSPTDLTLQEKRITGSYMGSNRFRFDMPKYVDFYPNGRLKLDEMISSRLALDQVNAAFDRMREGEAARQVIVFE